MLGDRIEAAALDVLDALIAATYTRGRDAMLTNANLGLERLRIFMRLSRELRLIHTAQSLTIPSPFWLGRYPVTRAQFATFVAESGYQTAVRPGPTNLTIKASGATNSVRTTTGAIPASSKPTTTQSSASAMKTR